MTEWMSRASQWEHPIECVPNTIGYGTQYDGRGEELPQKTYYNIEMLDKCDWHLTYSCIRFNYNKLVFMRVC